MKHLDKFQKELLEYLKVNKGKDYKLYSNPMIEPLDKIKKCFKQTNNIVLFGINPSSTDEQTDYDGILHYIPDDYLINEIEKKYYLELKKRPQKLFYEKYFKKPYDIFFKHGYTPYWTLPQVFQEVYSTLLKKFPELKEDNKLYLFLEELVKRKQGYNYIFTHDLVSIREVDSKPIVDFLNNRPISEKHNIITECMHQILDMYNPKIIFINNATVSDLLHYHYVKEKNAIYSSYKIPDTQTILVFSGIISQGLDKYNQKRLHDEIKSLLN